MKNLIDPFGRSVNYLRVSVTDRCDFRCVYCMSEDMSFLPKKDLLSLEELEIVCNAFIDMGVKKIRLTGGEPLVRKNIMQLINNLGSMVGKTLDELTITTNGSQLKKMAANLYKAGVRRLNISMDSLDELKFKLITRWGNLNNVLEGLEIAKKEGLKIKINTVALKGVNEDELDKMLLWCGEMGFDMTIIEVMPMGDIGGEKRLDQYLSLSDVRAKLEEKFTLVDTPERTAGPAKYVKVQETSNNLGFITPLTHNFCESCNRVRLTCVGQLFMCLGQEDNSDLRTVLRSSGQKGLKNAIIEAISRKPKGHDFIIDRNSTTKFVSRHMNVTGG